LSTHEPKLSTGGQAKKVIADLNNKGKIRTKGYLCSLFERKEDMTGRELYTWIFEKKIA